MHFRAKAIWLLENWPKQQSWRTQFNDVNVLFCAAMRSAVHVQVARSKTTQSTVLDTYTSRVGASVFGSTFVTQKMSVVCFCYQFSKPLCLMQAWQRLNRQSKFGLRSPCSCTT